MEPFIFSLVMAWALVRYGVTDLVATTRGTESPRHRERRQRLTQQHERRMARMSHGPTIGQAVAGRIARRIAEPRPPRDRSGERPFRRFLGEWWDDSWNHATEARHRHYDRKQSGDLPRQRAARAVRDACGRGWRQWRDRHTSTGGVSATDTTPASGATGGVPPETATERTGPIHVTSERLPLPEGTGTDPLPDMGEVVEYPADERQAEVLGDHGTVTTWPATNTEETSTEDAMPEHPDERRARLEDDEWFVDDCLFGRAGPAAQQACEQAINEQPRGVQWDHAALADQTLAYLPAYEPPTESSALSAEDGQHPTGERNHTPMTEQQSQTAAPTGEVTNLQTALEYTRATGEQFRSAVAHAETLAAQTQQVAEWAEQSSASAETSVAGITAGEVTGEAVDSLTAAQERMTSAASQVAAAADELHTAQEQLAATAAAFDTAHAAFQRQSIVAEAYAANPDAGSKQFNTLA